MGIRNAFLISNYVTLIGAIFIILFQSGIISPYFIDSMGCPDSGYPKGSDKDKKYHLDMIIPWFTFLAKVGSTITFGNAYYASFSDNRIFPLMQRATAIGICQFIARGLTVFSPMIAELDDPLPMFILSFIVLTGLIGALFFPSKAQQDALEKKIMKKVTKMEK